MPIAGALVWIRIKQPRKGGPLFAPEKWPIDAPSGGTDGREVVTRHPLEPAEYAMSIAILEQRYPSPTPPELT